MARKNAVAVTAPGSAYERYACSQERSPVRVPEFPAPGARPEPARQPTDKLGAGFAKPLSSDEQFISWLHSPNTSV